MIYPLFEAVNQGMKDAMQALADEDIDLARQVVRQKPEIERLASAAAEHLSQRLMADEPNRVRAFQVETDIISQTKRMHYYARRIARVIVGENGELKER
jgi:phosphate:Na+ symporter